MNPRNRRHLPLIGLVLLAIIALLYLCTTINDANAQAVTPTPQPAVGQLYIGPEAYDCHISGPTSYLCIRQDLSGTITPTRITPTNLVEGTNTATLRPTVTPTATRTPTVTALACVTRAIVNPVNTRGGPGANFAKIGTGLVKDTVVQIAEWRTVTTSGATSLWARLCGTGDPEVWFSATAAGVVR